MQSLSQRDNLPPSRPQSLILIVAHVPSRLSRDTALWLQPVCDTVVALDRAPPGFAGTVHLDRLGTPVATYASGRQRHLVIDANDMRHRLWVLEPDPGARLLILLPVSSARALAAAVRLRDDLANSGAGVTSVLSPTDFQRHRLTMLLAIVDAVQAGVSNRLIGTSLIYSRLGRINAQTWKASSERRHTQRLVAEAEAMVSHGYRRLLDGR